MPERLTPVETEAQARQLPAVRGVYAAFDSAPGVGRMAPHNLAMLTEACAAARVELGAYDTRILGWLAGWEPQTCAVIAGHHRQGRRGPAMRRLSQGTKLTWHVRSMP